MAQKSSQENRPRWYVVQTYVGFEDTVKRLLNQKIGNLNLQDKFLEIFIPTRKVIKLNSKNERIEKEEKVYPGYVYVHMLLNKETAYLVNNTQYVSKIAGTGDVVIPLEDGVVEELKKNLTKQQNEGKKEVKTEYQIGELVRVTEGPFKDMQGKISGMDPEKNRVNVLLTIFDRETDVELDVLSIERVVA